MQPYVLVRLKAATEFARANGRVIGHHGRFGNLHALPVAAALRLIDAGHAKLLPHLDLARLRAEVAAAAALTCPTIATDCAS